MTRRSHRRPLAVRPPQNAPALAVPRAALPDPATPSDSAVLHLVRVTIEAKTPLSPGSGDPSVNHEHTERIDGKNVPKPITETAIARDAYGLPTIPGATLQGLLRGLADNGSEVFKRAFGWAKGEDGAAAALQVGFARVHGELDKAVCGFLGSEEEAKAVARDPILSRLLEAAPMRRDHVKLNGQHVVDGRAKYTRLALPVGTRFSFELAMWSEPGDAAADGEFLGELVGLFNHPALRLGSGGKRGYGRVKVVKASYARPPLQTHGDLIKLRDLRQEPPSQHFAKGIEPRSAEPEVVVATLELSPLGPWRVGGDGPPATEDTHGVRCANGEADVEAGLDTRGKRTPENPDTPVPRDPRDIAKPAREPLIDWKTPPGAWREPEAAKPFANNPFSLPGSAVRGPLAHRAVFHWNRAHGRFIDADACLGLDEVAKRKTRDELATRSAELSRLLGSPKERLAKDARASRLIVDDGEVQGVSAIQGFDHNSIDRFTGGVRDGFLYAEEALVGGGIRVNLTILPPLEKHAEGGPAEWPDDVRQAFVDALADLCFGRLAIGAKSLGFCKGDIVEWSGRGAEPWRETWSAASETRKRGTAA